jgi:exonuclease III
MIYLRVSINKWASSGVAILVKKSLENKICNYSWVSDRIITICLKIERYHLNIIGVYAPIEGEEENSITFYDTLQKTLDGTNKNELQEDQLKDGQTSEHRNRQ